jgi:hypothetical protein
MLDAGKSALADVTGYASIISSIAADFVDFLTSGLAGLAHTWPSEFLEPLQRYGGYYLRPGDSDPITGLGTATYGGQPTTDQNTTYVGQLRQDLQAVGITCAGLPLLPEPLSLSDNRHHALCRKKFLHVNPGSVDINHRGLLQQI